MNKGFKILELLIYVALIVIFCAGIYVIGKYKLDRSTLNIGDVNCQHVFVVSSEYNWVLEQYRTVSRCAKCGMVI